MYDLKYTPEEVQILIDEYSTCNLDELALKLGRSRKHIIVYARDTLLLKRNLKESATPIGSKSVSLKVKPPKPSGKWKYRKTEFLDGTFFDHLGPTQAYVLGITIVIAMGKFPRRKFVYYKFPKDREATLVHLAKLIKAKYLLTFKASTVSLDIPSNLYYDQLNEKWQMLRTRETPDPLGFDIPPELITFFIRGIFDALGTWDPDVKCLNIVCPPAIGKTLFTTLSNVLKLGAFQTQPYGMKCQKPRLTFTWKGDAAQRFYEWIINVPVPQQ